MKHCHARSHTRSVSFAATLTRMAAASALLTLFALSAQAQSAGTAETRTAGTAQASTAAYTVESTRQESTATPQSSKRKPRWFDERRQQAGQKEASGRFERLSYTRYEGEAEPGSGNCVYYQNSYTYSCR